MKSLKDLLSGKSSSLLAKGLKASHVVTTAENILSKKFGPEIKKYALVAYYKNKTLAISCVSSTVAQEIKLNEEEILKELNMAIPGTEINKIIYLS